MAPAAAMPPMPAPALLGVPAKLPPIPAPALPPAPTPPVLGVPAEPPTPPTPDFPPIPDVPPVTGEPAIPVPPLPDWPPGGLTVGSLSIAHPTTAAPTAPMTPKTKRTCVIRDPLQYWSFLALF